MMFQYQTSLRYSVMRSILVWIVMKAATLDYLADPPIRNGEIKKWIFLAPTVPLFHQRTCDESLDVRGLGREELHNSNSHFLHSFLSWNQNICFTLTSLIAFTFQHFERKGAKPFRLKLCNSSPNLSCFAWVSERGVFDVITTLCHLSFFLPPFFWHHHSSNVHRSLRELMTNWLKKLKNIAKGTTDPGVDYFNQ